jgi:hypothetical protein
MSNANTSSFTGTGIGVLVTITATHWFIDSRAPAFDLFAVTFHVALGIVNVYQEFRTLSFLYFHFLLFVLSFPSSS